MRLVLGIGQLLINEWETVQTAMPLCTGFPRWGANDAYIPTEVQTVFYILQICLKHVTHTTEGVDGSL